MSDPHERGGLSVTLKQDGKDGMWMVFHGSPDRIKEDIKSAMAGEDESLFAVANEANKVFKAVTTVGRVLGGRVTENNSPAWEQAASTPAVPARDPLYDTIDSVTTTDALRILWAENRDKLDKTREGHDVELVAHWSARGKSLKAAGQ